MGKHSIQTCRKIASLLPNPRELKHLSKHGATARGRKQQSQIDKRFEVALRHIMGFNDWRPSGRPNSPEDLSGKVKAGRNERQVILDGKVVASASQAYSLKDSSVRNKLVESAGNPHSVIGIVGVNYSPAAGKGERGVFVRLGAPNTLNLSKGGAKSEFGPFRVLDGKWLDRLHKGDPAAIAKMQRGVLDRIRQANLKRYKAMEKEQALERQKKDVNNAAKISKAALSLGASSEQVASNLQAGLDELPKSTRHKLAEKMVATLPPEERAKHAAAAAATLPPEERAKHAAAAAATLPPEERAAVAQHLTDSMSDEEFERLMARRKAKKDSAKPKS